MVVKMKTFILLLLLSFFPMREIYATTSADDVLVTDKHIIEEVVELVKYTRAILKDLNDGEKYGEISWPNSLTIENAIDSIDGVLKEDPVFTLEDVKDYEKDVVEYFSTYIEDDLNERGVGVYKMLKNRQDDLFSRIYKIYSTELN